MNRILLDDNTNRYKCNLHCHTNISDGKLSPEEIKTVYKKNGYSVVAYTDHDIMIAHDELNDDNFLVLHGYEMEFEECGIKIDSSNLACHICLIQRDPNNMKQVCWHKDKYLIGNVPKYKEQVLFDESLPDFERSHTPENISKAMQIARENGFFVTYNHPTWSLESYSDYINYHGMHAMEICNYACCVMGFDEYNPRVYDDILRGGERIYCIGADDNHNMHPENTPEFDSCGAFTMVFAEELSYKAIMDAIFDGRFYASQGPEIYSLWCDENKIHLICSPAKRVYLSTNGRIVRCENSRERLITEQTFDIPKNNTYFRITIEDSEGKHANTNAYFIDDILK